MDGDHFELDFQDRKIRVQRRLVANMTVYIVAFSDKRKHLVLTRATADNAHYFWTSVPEGRQREAELVGPLIAEYISNNQ